MLLGVGGSLVAAFLFFSIGWAPLGVIALVVAGASFWGNGIAANFRDDPADMPGVAAFLAVVTRPAAIFLLVIAAIALFF